MSKKTLSGSNPQSVTMLCSFIDNLLNALKLKEGIQEK